MITYPPPKLSRFCLSDLMRINLLKRQNDLFVWLKITQTDVKNGLFLQM